MLVADDNGIYYLGEYQPRRGGSNPAHDDYSARILEVKDGDGDAIGEFEERLLEHASMFAGCDALVAVPPHSPESPTSGIQRVVDALAARLEINSEVRLLRTVGIPKAAHGGTRDIALQYDSMEAVGLVSGHGSVVAVIDDVTTSGASLLAARKVLVRDGARAVLMIALGKTV
jgi:predicted amidophosphoribosyltransferase